MQQRTSNGPARRYRPQPGDMVAASGHQQLAIGTEGDRKYILQCLMIESGTGRPTGREIKDSSDTAAGIVAAKRYELTVGGHGETLDVSCCSSRRAKRQRTQ